MKLNNPLDRFANQLLGFACLLFSFVFLAMSIWYLGAAIWTGPRGGGWYYVTRSAVAFIFAAPTMYLAAYFFDSCANLGRNVDGTAGASQAQPRSETGLGATPAQTKP